jgi:hypothetical protein
MSLKKECEVSWNKLLFALVHRTLLVSYMASQENVVIKAAVEVFLQATSHFGTNSNLFQDTSHSFFRDIYLFL